MYGLLLDHFLWFVIILYDDIGSLNISMEFFKPVAYGEAFSFSAGI